MLLDVAVPSLTSAARTTVRLELTPGGLQGLDRRGSVCGCSTHSLLSNHTKPDVCRYVHVCVLVCACSPSQTQQALLGELGAPPRPPRLALGSAGMAGCLHHPGPVHPPDSNTFTTEAEPVLQSLQPPWRPRQP